ncbi:hypothetical protein LZZ85_13780 [Terrimonas sp. NA20]|uniref:Uncharacterized protein n=1 Tax=Terrimonas ginsenosidimutans TaxID=2908004 RepID=A0ABS9KSQ2_9BACT|nr:hypothetical protein [Terrimonas ginsenosidimutans]MCG2615365.1 hypothetical protein [Terrimonas ginsenosidimutans]
MDKILLEKLDALDELAKACAADSSQKKTLGANRQPDFLARSIKTQKDADRFMDQLEAFTLLAKKRRNSV